MLYSFIFIFIFIFSFLSFLSPSQYRIVIAYLPLSSPRSTAQSDSRKFALPSTSPGATHFPRSFGCGCRRSCSPAAQLDCGRDGVEAAAAQHARRKKGLIKMESMTGPGPRPVSGPVLLVVWFFFFFSFPYFSFLFFFLSLPLLDSQESINWALNFLFYIYVYIYYSVLLFCLPGSSATATTTVAVTVMTCQWASFLCSGLPLGT